MFQRNIPEPPSIAAASPLGWVAVLPELAAREHHNADTGAVTHERMARAHTAMQSLCSAALTFFGGRRGAEIRSASASGMTSAG